MKWLLFEDTLVSIDRFNTILDPIMVYIVILLLILTLLWLFDYTEYKDIGSKLFSTRTSNIIKVLLLLSLMLIIIVGITNAIQHYAEELMLFDGYMYIDYKKEIIKMQ